jgi:peptide/nickel transport system substrate-binding protein
MPVSRRSLLKAAAAAPALSLPGILRAQSQTTLRFIPVIDLTFIDPIYSTAQFPETMASWSTTRSTA